MGKDKQVVNDKEVRNKLKDYYRTAELWLPPESSRRIYKMQGIKEGGEMYFRRIRDRISSKEKLREHLLEHTPLNVYFSTSCWLNPTKTAHKTYKKDWDGREHYDKNGFLYGDYFVDKDDLDKKEVLSIYRFIRKHENLSDEDMNIVFSGGGYHINIWQWYRNRSITSPIEREKDYQSDLMDFTHFLIDKGFKFDYSYHAQDEKLNCPSVDTRRVRKLPQTVTKYGNVSEVVEKEALQDFSPTTVIDEVKMSKTRMSLEELDKRIDSIAS